MNVLLKAGTQFDIGGAAFTLTEDTIVETPLVSMAQVMEHLFNHPANYVLNYPTYEGIFFDEADGQFYNRTFGAHAAEILTLVDPPPTVEDPNGIFAENDLPMSEIPEDGGIVGPVDFEDEDDEDGDPADGEANQIERPSDAALHRMTKAELVDILNDMEIKMDEGVTNQQMIDEINAEYDRLDV